LLLGAGELGKEFVIAAQRLGQYVVAADSYDDAPAQQVAHEREVIDMLDGRELDRIVKKHKPDIIVPEIEAIRTERFYTYDKKGIQVVPSARAANYTMNRKALRNLVAEELDLRTAKYAYAKTRDELIKAVSHIRIPCVVKPLMSSSGKGQSVVRHESEIEKAWNYAMEGSRGDVKEVIVEQFIRFNSEITLLTVTQKNGKTLFCPPIGHRQEHGDYQESWQPHPVKKADLEAAQNMADEVTRSLTGAGIWGVEFFLTEEGVYFSELSPRPHDTGMVTLAGTQNLNEFELHLRAVLGLPIPKIELLQAGASAVVLADRDGFSPQFKGIENALAFPKTDVRVFGKPSTRPHRRMAVALVSDKAGADIHKLRERAIEAAGKISVTPSRQKG